MKMDLILPITFAITRANKSCYRVIDSSRVFLFCCKMFIMQYRKNIKN